MSIDVQVQQPAVTVDPGQTGRLKFTVTNVSEAALQVVAQVIASSDGAPPLPGGVAEIDRPGRSLAAGGMDEFVVTLAPPLETAPATYGFVLHVASSAGDAVQVWGQSPQVAVTIPQVEIPKPPWWPKWAMIAAALVLAVIIGSVLYSVFGGGRQWQVQQALEPSVLRPGESISVGVAESGADKVLTFAGGIGTIEQLTISEAPIVATSAIPSEDEIGDDCLVALESAPAALQAPVPIDGRPVCTFVGPELIGVVIVHSLEPDQITVSLDVWSVG